MAWPLDTNSAEASDKTDAENQALTSWQQKVAHRDYQKSWRKWLGIDEPWIIR